MSNTTKFSLIFAVVGLIVGALMSFITKGNIAIDMIIGTLAGAVVGYFLNSFILRK